jgi:hypothetical protein
MIEAGIMFMIGLLIGLVLRPKDPELQDQKKMYDTMYKKYIEDIQYYKDLCKWHAERSQNESKTSGSV